MRLAAISLILLHSLAGSHAAFQSFWNFQPVPVHPRRGDQIASVDREFPSRPFRRLVRDMDDMLADVIEVVERDKQSKHGKNKGTIEFGLRPSFDVHENDNGFVFTCLTPGLRKDELQVEVVDGETKGTRALVIRGETKVESKKARPEEGESQKGGEHQNEDGADAVLSQNKQNSDEPASGYLRMRYRKFKQSWELPADVNQDTMEAKYEDGILSVFIPRKAAAPPTPALKLAIK